MSFVPPALLDRLASLPRDVADAQPFGVIRLDDAGVVQLFNRWESALSGVPTASAEGRNFFTEVAPCTNNRLVYGRFRDGVAGGALDTEFDYTFTYRMKPTQVVMRLLRHAGSRTNWIFVGAR